MTAEELFPRLAPYVGPLLNETYGKQSLCILATRVVIEVGAYFGIDVQPRCVQAIIHNKVITDYLADIHSVSDITLGTREELQRLADLGGYTVGIGFGIIRGVEMTNDEMAALSKFNGHLIAQAGDVVGDFSIAQAERPDRGILLGPAFVGRWPRNEPRTDFVNSAGVTVQYRDQVNEYYRRSPDWNEPTRRKKMAGALIKLVR